MKQDFTNWTFAEIMDYIFSDEKGKDEVKELVKLRLNKEKENL